MLSKYLKNLDSNMSIEIENINSNIKSIQLELSELKEVSSEGFDDIGYELSHLYKILTPSKHKALLDISIKLYDDEVSRYRFLEEKANKILGFIGLLLPIYLSFIVWLLKEKNIILSCLSKILVSVTALDMIVIIFVLLLSFKFVSKPYVIITNETKRIVKTESIDTVNLHFYNAFIPSIESYISANESKSKLIDNAYKLIILMYVLSLCVTISIGYNYLI